MKHEYTFEELAELKKIYDESGEAGLSITEMRALRKEGLLPRNTRETTTTGKKETMTNTAIHERNPQSEPEDPRAVIADRLGTLHNAMLGVLSASFDAGDKVAYAYSCKLLSGEIMDLKANYSKDAK